MDKSSDFEQIQSPPAITAHGSFSTTAHHCFASGWPSLWIVKHKNIWKMLRWGTVSLVHQLTSILKMVSSKFTFLPFHGFFLAPTWSSWVIMVIIIYQLQIFPDSRETPCKFPFQTTKDLAESFINSRDLDLFTKSSRSPKRTGQIPIEFYPPGNDHISHLGKGKIIFTSPLVGNMLVP